MPENAHSPPPELAVDRSQIAQFYDVMFRHVPEGSILSLRTFDQFNRGIPALEIKPLALTSDAAADVAAIVAAAQRAADHSSPAVFAPPVATFANGHHARSQDLEHGVAVSAEVDEGDPNEALAKASRILGPPTVVMHSGSETIEGKPKLHAHWRLNEPTASPEAHEKLARARKMLAGLVGSDPTASPVNHPLRWPGSWNRKGTPRMATTCTVNEDVEISLDAAFDALAEAVEAAGGGIKTPARGAGQTQADPELLAAAVAAIPNADVHYGEWVDIAYAICGATGGSAAGFEMFDAFSRKSEKYDAEETERTWNKTVAAAPDKIGAGTIFWKAGLAGWKRPPTPIPFKDETPPTTAPDRFKELVKHFTEVLAARGGRALSGKMFGDLDEADAETRPVIKGWINEGDVVAVAGDSGTFKTYDVVNKLMCKATGTPWAKREGFAGYPVGEASAVAMFAGEGPRGVIRRIKADIAGNQRNRALVEKNLLFVPTVYALNRPEGLAGMAMEIEAKSIRPKLIGVDTFNLALDGNEDSSEEIKKSIAGARALGVMFDAGVLIVDHMGHTDKSRQRGSSAKKANEDGVILCVRPANGDTVTLKQDKNRDADKRDFVVTLRGQKIEVGRDRETGEPITDLWFEAVEPLAAADVRGLFKDHDAGRWVACDLAAKEFLDSYFGLDVPATDLARKIIIGQMPELETAEPEKFAQVCRSYRKHLVGEPAMASYIAERTPSGSEASTFRNPAQNGRRAVRRATHPAPAMKQ